MQGTYKSISAISNKNYSIGHHWFDTSTMSFFGTRIHSDLYGGCVFVTSDKQYNGERMYSVRVAMDDGTIHSYAFVEYDTRAQAHKEGKWLGQALTNGEMGWSNTRCEFVSNELFTQD